MATADLPQHETSISTEPFSIEHVTSAVIYDPDFFEEVRRQRAERGSDRFDEVWEGVYVMSPIANWQHQDIVGGLTAVLRFGLHVPQSRHLVLPGTNVSDRIQGWSKNYRCPDVVVYLESSKAERHEAFFKGGPDFAVEVVSEHDRTREKLDFYAKVETGELLIVDRDPWRLELLRLADGELKSVGVSTVEDGQTLASERTPFTFKLQAGEERPAILVSHTGDGQSWVV